jgi:N-acetyl-anhydromuramyl-L-alanine amidase AmpD
MKATELRVGNYFQWIEIASMGIGVDVITKNNHYTYEDFKEPIPLTEEWLKRLGFEYSEHERTDSGLWKLIPPFQIYGKCNQFIYDYRLDVNYVHSLQNLYYALTGEELNQNN